MQIGTADNKIVTMCSKEFTETEKEAVWAEGGWERDIVKKFHFQPLTF